MKPRPDRRPDSVSRTAAWRLALARVGLLLLASLAVAPARAAQPVAQVGAEGDSYLPYFIYSSHFSSTGNDVFLPLVMRAVDQLLPGLIANPSFESTSWFTDGAGNQHPAGWTFTAYNTGQTLPFPTKQQGSGSVPAISGGHGEYVHKFFWQLPGNEQVGAVRGLILQGSLTYKVFSDHLAHALRLSQTLTHSPGRWVRVTGYVLGETNVTTCSGGSGVLEPDHFVASVRLGTAADTRFYSVMRTRHDVPGNERAWNKFSVVAQVPANGQLPLVVIVQTNWACPVDFFIDHFQAYETATP